MIRLAQVIQSFEADSLAQYRGRLTADQLKALAAIGQCRTHASAKIELQCPQCEHRSLIPHSCGHRHCPHCQAHESQQWIERQVHKQVPAQYLLLSFTLPAEFRPLAWAHQQRIYDLLLSCAWQSVRTFSRNDRHLQGTPGAIAVLHTNTRRLDYHPHVHLVMTAAAIDTERKRWRTKRRGRAKGLYLFNHKALATVFRAKMLAGIEAAGLALPPRHPSAWVVDPKPDEPEPNRGVALRWRLSGALECGGAMELLTTRYSENLVGVLSCYDRIVITGTVPGACFADGMTSFLYSRGIRIFDYPQFALPLRERIRVNAATLAAEHGATIEHIAKAHIRKEDVVAKVLAVRGDAPGLVHVISAMEACATYQPWHDKLSGRTFLRPDTTKCLHYYFYWMDRELGLLYVRVPTYCPFRLQVYCNGHSWLAKRLLREGIDFAAADNAFVRIADFARAQELADTLKPDLLHRHLDRYAQLCCPVLEVFGQTYHWSLMQAEYSTDLVFKSEQILRALYEQLAREAVLSVKAEHVATFLGKKLTPQVAAEIGSRLSTRIEGTCIKHKFDSCSIKIYDKFARILRIETTTNDVSFFKHHRKVEHRSGRATREVAPLKKSIYSLVDLRDILLGCNQRYLEFLSSLDDHSSGTRLLQRITHPKPDGDRSFKGVNFFDLNDQELLRAVQRPEFNIHGLARCDLMQLLPDLSPSRLSRQLRRLRVLGLLKRAANTYRYYLTRAGRMAIAAFERLTTFAIVPALANA